MKKMTSWGLRTIPPRLAWKVGQAGDTAGLGAGKRSRHRAPVELSPTCPAFCQHAPGWSVQACSASLGTAPVPLTDGCDGSRGQAATSVLSTDTSTCCQEGGPRLESQEGCAQGREKVGRSSLQLITDTKRGTRVQG